MPPNMFALLILSESNFFLAHLFRLAAAVFFKQTIHYYLPKLHYVITFSLLEETAAKL